MWGSLDGDMLSGKYMPTVTCRKCEKPFMYWEVGGGGPLRGPEDIHCPHCRDVRGTKQSGGVFDSRELTPDELAAYRPCHHDEAGSDAKNP
jgi:hypothetical protein